HSAAHPPAAQGRSRRAAAEAHRQQLLRRYGGGTTTAVRRIQRTRCEIAEDLGAAAADLGRTRTVAKMAGMHAYALRYAVHPRPGLPHLPEAEGTEKHSRRSAAIRPQQGAGLLGMGAHARSGPRPRRE